MLDRRQQLVILWEGASWADLHPLMDAGRMPHLEKLTERGVMGKLQGVVPPGVSGVISLATGQAPCDHGVIHDLKSASPHQPVDEVTRSDWRPVWDQLAAKGDRCLEVGWPLTHPAASHLAASVSDRFSWPARTLQYRFCLPKDSIEVPSHLEGSLRDCRVVSSELGLEMVMEFLGVEDENDLPEPGRLAKLKVALASIRSVQAAALLLMKELEWDVCSLGFDGLRRLFEVSCRQEVPFEEKERFYELLDRMLGEILEDAPEDVVVHLVSASAFRMGSSGRCFSSDEGIWVISGSGVVADGLIHGGHVLEVAPTILALRGEQPNEGMKRSPRLDLLTGSLAFNPRVEGSFGAKGEAERKRPWSHLLGDGRTLNVATPGQLQDPRIAAGLYEDRHFGEFQSLIEMGEKDRAYLKGRELIQLFPGDFRVGLGYAGCLVEKGRWDEFSDLLSSLQGMAHSQANAVDLGLLECGLLRHQERDDELAARLSEMGKEHHLPSTQWMKVAAFYGLMKKHDQALVIYRGLTKRDPSMTSAWLRIAETLLRLGNLQDAETVARHLVSLNGTLERGLLLLAKILFRLGRKEEAVGALERLHQSGRGSRRSRRMARFYEAAAN